jgi:hypothetical protein
MSKKLEKKTIAKVDVKKKKEAKVIKLTRKIIAKKAPSKISVAKKIAKKAVKKAV